MAEERSFERGPVARFGVIEKEVKGVESRLAFDKIGDEAHFARRSSLVVEASGNHKILFGGRFGGGARCRGRSFRCLGRRELGVFLGLFEFFLHLAAVFDELPR